MKRNVRELLGGDVIDALRAPQLEHARGLPGAAYTSEEFFELEREILFPRTWIGVAFDSDVPNPGDVMPLTVCGLPLLLTRDETGAIHVLHNVCRHRATIVVDAPCHQASNVKCPYHGWVYGLDGKLLATPFWDGTADTRRTPVDPDTNSLVPVRSGVWNHVVFVNLNGVAEPLAQYLAPMAAELEHLQIAELQIGYRVDWEFEANWKLMLDNWEVYHHVWVHAGVFDKMSDEVDMATGEPYTETLAEDNVLMLRYKENRPPPALQAAASKLPSIRENRPKREPTSVANAVLPNTTVTIGATAYTPSIYVPIAPGVTCARMAWYFPPKASGPEHASARDAIVDRWLGPTRKMVDRGGIRAQDFWCLEQQQLARGSPVADDVKFSPTWEYCVAHFQRWLIQQLEAGG